MNRIIDIELLPLKTSKEMRKTHWHLDEFFVSGGDYPRWFIYHGRLFSLLLMDKAYETGWDFEAVSVLNEAIFAAVLDEKTVKVGRIPYVL